MTQKNIRMVPTGKERETLPQLTWENVLLEREDKGLGGWKLE